MKFNKTILAASIALALGSTSVWADATNDARRVDDQIAVEVELEASDVLNDKSDNRYQGNNSSVNTDNSNQGNNSGNTASNLALAGAVSGNSLDDFRIHRGGRYEANNHIDDSFNGAAGINQTVQNSGFNSLSQQMVSVQGTVNVGQ